MAAGNALSIEAKLDDKGVLRGVKEMRTATEQCAKSADHTNERFGALSVTLGNLASRGIEAVITQASRLARSVVDIGSGFETSMSKVAALSGATGEDFAALEAKARELGASTTFTASQAADALGYMALAGWDTKAMLDGVGPALQLAQAGEMDLAAASDLVTDYLSAFNMTAGETQRMVDVLAYAQANANTTVEGLGMAFKNCAANANAAGMNVETTTAAIAQMANQGLKGSEAGTALNAVMRDMTARMKDGAIEVGKTRVAIQDAQGNYRDFIDIIRDVENATEGMGDAEKAAALQSTFTADSIKGMNLLLNAGADEAEKFRDELYNCAGAAEQTAATMTDNLGGDVAEMQSAFEELAIKIYQGLQEPLRDAVQWITGTVVPGIEALVANIDLVAPALVGMIAGIVLLKNQYKLLNAGKDIIRALTADTKTYTTVTSTAGVTVKGYGMKVKAAATEQTAFSRATKGAMQGVKLQTASFKASTVAINAGRIALKGFSAALKTIAPIAAMTALVEVVAAIGSSMERSREHAQKLEDATTSVTSAHSAFASSAAEAARDVQAAADSTQEYTANLADVQEAVSDALEGNADLARSLHDLYSEAGTNVGMLESYSRTIKDLAGESDLSEPDVARLELAVKNLGEATGKSMSVVRDEAGAYQIMVDGAIEAKDSILDLIEAQQLQIQLEANLEAQKEAYKQHTENTKAAAEAQKIYNEKLEAYNEINEAAEGSCLDYDIALSQASKELEDARAALKDASSAANASGQAMKYAADQATLLKMAQNAAADSATAAVASNLQLQAALDVAGISSLSFAEAMEEVGANGAALAGLLPEQAAQVADAYSTSYQAAADKLAEFGIISDETSAKEQAALAMMQADLNNFASAATPALDSLKGNFNGTFDEIVAACETNGVEIPATLANAISGASSLPADAQSAMLTALVLQMTGGDVTAAAEILGGDIDQGLVSGIQQGGDLPAEAAAIMSQDVLERMRTEFQSHSPALTTQAIGGDVDAGLTNGINGGADGPLTAMGTLAQSCLSAISGMPDQFGSTGSAASAAMAQGISKSPRSVTTAVATLTNAAKSGISISATTFQAAGKTAADAFVTPIASTDAFNAGRSLALTAEKGLQSANSMKLGQDFALGYGQGIAGQGSWVYQRAYELAQQAVHGVQDAQQSASPSKVARGLGGDYGQGYGLGIQDEFGFVQRSGEGLVESAIANWAAPTAGIDWYSTAGRFAGRTALGLGSAQEAPTISVNVEEGSDSSAILRAILEEIRALHKDLPKLLAHYCQTAIEIDGRTFGRLVNESLEDS